MPNLHLKTNPKKILSVVTLAISSTVVLAMPFARVQAVVLENPLGAGTTFGVLLGRIINFLLYISGAVALLALVSGGLYMMAAFGDEGRIKKGKTIVFWALAGLAVIALSWIIIRVLVVDVLKVEGIT